MPKFLKIILIIAAVFVVVFAAAGITLKMIFTPEKLRTLIMPKIEQAVDRKVMVNKFSLKVWTGLGVELDGIELANAKGFADQPMVKVESIVLKINLLGLLKRQLVISSLVIDKPEILIEKDIKGVFNFSDLVKPAPQGQEQKTAAPPSSSPVSLAMQSFRIKDGRFEFEDRQGKVKALAFGINEELSFSADLKLENIRTKGTIKVADISAEAPGLKVSKIYVNINHDIAINLPKKIVTINDITVAPQGIAFSLGGTVTNFDSLPILDLALKTSAIEIKQIINALPPEIKAQAKDVQATGQIELGLKVTGQIDPKDPRSLPKVDGSMALKNIGIKYAMLPKSVSDVNGQIAFSEKDLNIKNISAKLGTAGFSMSCLVQNFENPYVKAAFKGNFDLGEVKDYVPLEEGLTLSGKINADFKAEGKIKDVNSFKMDGKIELRNLNFATAALLKPVSDMNGTVQLTKNLINIPDISCKIGRSSMSFNAQVKNFLSLVPEQPAPKGGKAPVVLPKQGKAVITFALNSPLLDLDEMLPPPPKASDAAKSLSDKKAPPVMLPLPDMLMDGKVRIAKIKFLKIDFDNLAGNLTLADRKLNLDGQVNVYSGKVRGTVWADLNDLTKIEYRLGANAEKLEADDFLTALTPLDNRMHAKLDVKGDFSGLAPDTILIKKTLKGQGKASTGEGKITNWPMLADILSYCNLSETREVSFRSLTMGFRIADEKIYLDDLQMASKFGDVSLSGSSSFLGYLDYRVSITLTKEESDKVKLKGGNVAGLFTNKDGRVALDLLVKGQSPKPGIGLDTQMAQARLKGKAQEEIDKAKKQAEEAAQKQAEELKKKAAEEAKKLFKWK
ncbi:AsmA family protein [candidate division TA06 bacterium]|uniref:AsmA family protein n=1 Tax=candidate division TA06 bacterium TaxID=2250710 RepID=A0A933MJI4_UNCT6|nr:AsmA family protein [candidate division TA06 bacterium]